MLSKLVKQQQSCSHGYVLILVLMEYALEEVDMAQKVQDTYVLILVLMEYALEGYY